MFLTLHKSNCFISLDVAAADGYALGLLLHAVFNPDHPPPATAEPPHPPPPASSRGAIPVPIFPLFKKLLNPNPTARVSAKHFLEVGMTESGFFSTNRLVKVCVGLDNFAISSDGEKATFLRYPSLTNSSVHFDLTPLTGL
jgi:SCY1-like protein 1